MASASMQAVCNMYNSNTLPYAFDLSPANFTVRSSVRQSVPSNSAVHKSNLVCVSFKGDSKCLSNRNSRFTKKFSKRFVRVSMGMDDFSRDNNSVDPETYLEAQVVDAVRMVPSCNRLYMNMMNGEQVEVVHVNPTAGRLLHQSSTPTIFLRILNSSNLMLPIVVGDAAVMSLMKALHKDGGGRPNQYELMGNLVQLLNYEVRMVKVTDRVVDTYIARVYFGKAGWEPSDLLSVDARPSDAINLAVKCKVPIFVNRSIVLNDSVRPAHKPMFPNTPRIHSPGMEKDSAVLDRAIEENDVMMAEMTLLKNMMIAVSEERYNDAARIRDELNRLRQKGPGHLNRQL